MDCNDLQLLQSAYEGGEDAAHLRACGRCRDALAAIRDVRAAYAATRTETLPARFRPRRIPAFLGLAAAVLLSIGAVALMLLPEPPAPRPPEISVLVVDADAEIGEMIHDVHRRLDAFDTPAPRRPTMDRDLDSIRDQINRLERRTQ